MKKTVSLWLITLLILLPMLGRATSVDIQEVPITEQHRAWLIEDHRLPVVHMSLAFTHAGSAHAPEGKEGLPALALEMLMRGAGEYDQIALSNQLAEHGIEFESYVSKDHAYLSFTVLTEHVDEAIRLVKLMLTEATLLDATLEQTKAETIAYIEKREESPSVKALDNLNAILFLDHPYRYATVGTKAGVNTITTEDVRRFVDGYFTADNVVISATGDVSAEALQRAISPLVEAISSRRCVCKALADTPAFPTKQLRHEQQVVKQSSIRFALPGLPYLHPDFYALMVTNHVLGGGGFSSRLMQDIREDNGWAYATGSALRPRAKSALWLGYADTKPDTTESVVAALTGHIERLQQEGISETELRHAKQFLTRSFLRRFDKLSQLVNHLTFIQIEDLGIDFFDRRNGLIEALTLQDIQRVSRAYIAPEHLIFSVVEPHKNTSQITVDALEE